KTLYDIPAVFRNSAYHAGAATVALTAVAWRSSHDQFVIGTSNGTTLLQPVAGIPSTGIPQPLPPRKYSINSISSSGTYIALGGADSRIEVWDLSRGEPAFRYSYESSADVLASPLT